MKKNIIISLILLCLAITGFVTYQYFSSFKEVAFNVKQTGLTVDIYKADKNNQKISTFNSDTKLALQNGDYYYIATGTKVDSTTQHSFKLDNSTKVIDIDPDYSDTYLASQLATETVAIKAVLNSTYPTLISQYDIFSSQLYKKGDWYGASLVNNVDNQDGFKDTYRVILHKDNSTWVMVHYPEIVVTKTNFPNVPIDVLNSVNDLLAS